MVALAPQTLQRRLGRMTPIRTPGERAMTASENLEGVLEAGSSVPERARPLLGRLSRLIDEARKRVDRGVGFLARMRTPLGEVQPYVRGETHVARLLAAPAIFGFLSSVAITWGASLSNSPFTWKTCTGIVPGSVTACRPWFFGIPPPAVVAGAPLPADKDLFIGLVALSALILPLGLWRPPSVYAGQGDVVEKRPTTVHEIVRFVRHRPLWPAMLVWLLWQFSPCSATPLLFFLTERLGATSDQYGLFMGLFYMSLMPAPIAYGFLCKRIRFSQLLFCSTFLAIPQAIPLLFLRTPPQSLFLAPLLGLLGGLPTCAYYELLLRSSPKGLEGAAMMMSSTVLFLAIRFGDIFGSWLYGRGGFGLAAWVTTGVYAIIPLVLAFVPRSLIAYTDGSHSP